MDTTRRRECRRIFYLRLALTQGVKRKRPHAPSSDAMQSGQAISMRLPYETASSLRGPAVERCLLAYLRQNTLSQQRPSCFTSPCQLNSPSGTRSPAAYCLIRLYTRAGSVYRVWHQGSAALFPSNCRCMGDVPIFWRVPAQPSSLVSKTRMSVSARACCFTPRLSLSSDISYAIKAKRGLGNLIQAPRACG